MKTLNASNVRNHFPAVIDAVAHTHQAVVVTRYGKPIVSIVPYASETTPETRYPLRGQPVSMAADFDEPIPALWRALSGAEKRPKYVAEKSRRKSGGAEPVRTESRTPRKGSN